jgi:hypothetical protein
MSPDTARANDCEERRTKGGADRAVIGFVRGNRAKPSLFQKAERGLGHRWPLPASSPLLDAADFGDRRTADLVPRQDKLREIGHLDPDGQRFI